MTKEKSTVPRLRFPGFTDAWKQRKLGEVAVVVMGQSPDSKNYTNNPLDNILVQGNADLKNGNVEPRVWTTQITKIAEKGDIIVSVRAPVGDVAKTRYKVVLGRGVAGIKGNDFIYQTLIRMKQFGYWMKLSTGSTFESINSGDIKSSLIPLPTLPEQEAIGSFFSDLDQLITLHQRKLDDVKELKKALLQKMFPKGNGNDFPELRFPEFTDAWKQRKLGEVATFAKGNGYSKKDLVIEGSPIILYGRLYTKYETVISEVDTFVSVEDNKNSVVYSEGGEVLVPASGESSLDIARASVVAKKGIILGGDINIIRLHSEIFPVFLALTISNGKQQKGLSKRAQGKSVVHLHNSDLKKVDLDFPTLPEQEAIGSFFSDLDQLITLHQRQLDHLKLLKKALLQQMFI
ncbi:restriction endonuclease subunit S [Streptococcus suis]